MNSKTLERHRAERNCSVQLGRNPPLHITHRILIHCSNIILIGEDLCVNIMSITKTRLPVFLLRPVMVHLHYHLPFSFSNCISTFEDDSQYLPEKTIMGGAKLWPLEAAQHKDCTSNFPLLRLSVLFIKCSNQ